MAVVKLVSGDKAFINDAAVTQDVLLALACSQNSKCKSNGEEAPEEMQGKVDKALKKAQGNRNNADVGTQPPATQMSLCQQLLPLLCAALSTPPERLRTSVSQ